MEKKIKIKTQDNHYLYGLMSGLARQPLFIVVHGLPGSMDEDLYLEATRWFAKQGYATFRFNLYGAQEDARQLMESTLETHASDIDTIVRYFHKNGFKKIYIAGHSYGGPSILLSKDRAFDGAVLWDPSYKVSFTKKEKGTRAAQYLKEVKGYVMYWGTNFILGEQMVDEANSLAWNMLTKDFHIPLKIVVAEKGSLLKGAQQYFKIANEPKDLIIFKGATHYFNNKSDTREKLFKASENWFKKFMK